MRVFMQLAADGVTPFAFFNTDVHGDYPGPGYPDAVIEITADQWSDAVNHSGFRRWNAATGQLDAYAPPALPAPQPYLTGRDVVDGMSPAQAKAADAEDPRNLARISAARMAAEVKSCIARVAKANGIEAAALLAQATPTGV